MNKQELIAKYTRLREKSWEEAQFCRDEASCTDDTDYRDLMNFSFASSSVRYHIYSKIVADLEDSDMGDEKEDD